MRSLNQNEKIGVFAGLLAVLLFFVLGPLFFFPSSNPPLDADFYKASVLESIDTSSLENLLVEDVVIGTGDALAGGERVIVHYVGQLLDGTIFDSSLEREKPIAFTFGVGEVIAGWDQGLLGMKVGGVRTLVIPPRLGYVDVQVGLIPANSTLLFQVMLVEIVK